LDVADGDDWAGECGGYTDLTGFGNLLGLEMKIQPESLNCKIV